MTTQENMLARHSILHELGRGPIGAVYAARDRTTGALVALKRLDPSLSRSDAGVVGRVLAQVRSARRLRHRSVARIHDAGEAAGTVYVSMEMLEGENLRAILDRGPLPVARAIRIAHEIAAGLAHAHLEGVLHGGLKPSNVIVLRSGAVKITDFGIAQAAPPSAARPGASGYASPEQLRGEPIDHRADLFSLGVVLYEMLTGRRPAEGEPQPPGELNRHVPRALDAVVLSLLAAQPAARMPGVPVLLQELQRLEEALGLGSTERIETSEPSASVPPAAGPEEFQHRRITDRELLDVQRTMMQRESRPERPSRSGPAIFAALALLLGVLGIAVTYYIGLAEVPEDLRVAEAPKAVQEPSPPIASVPDPTPPKPLPEPDPAPQVERPIARAPAPPPPPPPLPSAEPAGGTARLIVAVAPRGELYVDGEHRGTTPPTTTFELEPGMHRIEVRNGSRKPYLTYMTVEAGDVRRIRHDFNAKPIRPPR